MTTPNPPIPGHHLIAEGGLRRHNVSTSGLGIYTYGCECGAQPERWTGTNATKRWHRAHKAELRGEP